MRISTFTTYYIGSTDMSNLQSTLQKLQMQLDTQKRVVNPSDDPVAASQILQLSQSNGRNDQFITNNKSVESTLAISETAIGNSINVMRSLKELAVQAGGGGLSVTQLQSMQVQVTQYFNQLVANANTTDGIGTYLFGGNKDNAPPFTADSALNTTYNGDTGQRLVEISSSRRIPTNEVGSQVFGNTPASSSPTALFDSVKAFHDLLGQNPKPANFATQLTTIMGNMDAASQNLVNAQASIGSRRKENEDTQNTAEDATLQYKSAISNLQDLDLPQTISDFSLTQASLQYSQLTFNKITSLSLFNYIS
ncbi:flagellar hook-filament junction protein FlgL [Paludibacterium paludis]|uniref:Flagellar hook-filament junction protein FlgL n=2 Tax=Paludibacterium paludis TaxID=1225769 RepID=A0A918NYE0_9NEIS|nr:flagellar hook-filament junction protein FlgL [Paludibacterium paludis]